MPATDPSTDTYTLAAALDVLSRDIHSDDGVAAAAITEAAQRLRALEFDVVHLGTQRDAEARRAIAFGDVIQSHIIAMRAAVVAAAHEGADQGMTWIRNTLRGPGFLPDPAAEASAQALWDRETAQHEAHRAKHPAPGGAL